ncbi:tRNA synthetases class I-domain-containing protein [Dipodascopsis tothii]|uniref:tRNA synthetases class I-domain-containing protein n=1 Tax=Dipodascopsis tothii TaxID=44089 RepID=UPI0034CE0E10
MSATPAASPEKPAENAPPKQKTAKELEKERKKEEKMAKFLAKENKKKASAPSAAKAEKKAKVVEEVPAYVELTKEGEKKVLQDLNLPALKSYNPAVVESAWYAWWESQGFFEPEFEADGSVKKEGVFTIPAPPPNVTGALHIGHALTNAIQDSLVRFYRMKGQTVLFVPGFDHAGISTQSVVEKMLYKGEGLTRHDLGREKFTEKVWEWKELYHARIKKQMKRLGSSYDWSREAFTLDEPRSAAVEHAFITLFEDGTLYRANRLVNWCCALNTTLSNIEVVNKEVKGRTLLSVPGYADKVEFGAITSFAYPVEGSDEKLVVATTRPETIFGDTAVAVHPEDPRYKHLHGKFVVHPFVDRRLPIVTDAEAVDMEFGTGAVKITPAHDQNDYNTGKRHDLEFINILNDNGTLNENCGAEWAGMKRFDARKAVIAQLEQKGLYVGTADNEMSIPCCEKSGDVIEPVLKPQWWVKLDDMAADAIKALESKELKIQPATSEQEYLQWLRNIQDWCISRQLWWGHRCPAYFIDIEGKDQDDSDNHWWVVGRSEDEARAKAEAKFPGEKFTLKWDEDVLDTWFSSGLWPMTTLGWPNKDALDLKTFAPMSMLETGWDILFFWVTRMVMLGIKLNGQVPFKEVFCHSLVRDAQGRKMSKSLGNVIDPLDVITGTSLEALHAQLRTGNLAADEIARAEAGQRMSYPKGIPECGTDALRFALCAYTTGGRDINLDILRIEGYRKFCNKIYQATKFALMRLGDDYVPPARVELTGKESLVEKWLLHKYTTAAQTMAKSMDSRDFLTATTTVYNFWLYELCDVYIENSKYLIGEDASLEEQKSAKDTLYNALDGALRMIHPFMPFITEELWQRIPRRPQEPSPTIVRARYPEYQPELDNAGAEASYELVFSVVKAARSLLAQYNITKGARIYVETDVAADRATFKTQVPSILSLIKNSEPITILESGDKFPEGVVVSVVTKECTVAVLVKGQVNVDDEIKKAESKMAKAVQGKTALEKLMSSKDYVTKVKAEVQELNNNKVQTFDTEIEGLKSMIADFEKLRA